MTARVRLQEGFKTAFDLPSKTRHHTGNVNSSITSGNIKIRFISYPPRPLLLDIDEQHRFHRIKRWRPHPLTIRLSFQHVNLIMSLVLAPILSLGFHLALNFQNANHHQAFFAIIYQ